LQDVQQPEIKNLDKQSRYMHTSKTTCSSC